MKLKTCILTSEIDNHANVPHLVCANILTGKI
jgi:hypothetical protein